MIFCKTKTGNFHRNNQKPCEDAVRYEETDGLVTAVVADGATACLFGGEGARLAAEAALDFVRKEKDFIFEYTDKKLCYLLTEHILYMIEKYAGHDADNNEYGSTLMMTAMRKKDGKTVIVKIGNGKCTVQKENGIYDPFERCSINRLSYLTTTRDSYLAGMVWHEQLKDGEYILMCTDGMLSVLKKHTRTSVTHSLEQTAPLKLMNYINEADENDDMSFLMLIRNAVDEQTEKID